MIPLGWRIAFAIVFGGLGLAGIVAAIISEKDAVANSLMDEVNALEEENQKLRDEIEEWKEYARNRKRRY